jgi:allophanate hydrolase
VMLLPTAGTIYTIDAMLADPVRLNSNLGTYTNFVNLMDLSAIAVPAGFRPNNLPFGVTLIGPAFADGRIAALADRLHRALPDATLGGSRKALPPIAPLAAVPGDTIEIAVVGAHLSGEPLNHQLTSRDGIHLRTTRTAAGYSLYALAGTVPAKPGLVRDGTGEGGIEVEIWALSPAAFGAFVAEIPSPLGIGTLILADGSPVKGFICEPYGLDDARDITSLGGWRAFRKSLA